MSETARHKRLTLGRVARAAWKDGWVGAWAAVTGLALLVSLTASAEWLAGAFFGVQLGLVGGYFVTQQRNYRRTSRESLEWELARMKQLRLRTIARQTRPSVDRDDLLAHLDESERLIREAIEVLT